jgi:F0F1-type ATP synthase membrane subunit a
MASDTSPPAAPSVGLRLSESGDLTRAQNSGKAVVETIRAQTQQVSEHDAGPYLPFIGTLFLFIALCRMVAVVPLSDRPRDRCPRPRRWPLACRAACAVMPAPHR